jgi:PPOX class probable F420-dependent enzyme
MPRLEVDDCRTRFSAARRVVLATARASGAALVPVTFVVQGDEVITAVDHKPKTTTGLQRLADIDADPRVTMLADHYDDDDWDQLWWVRAQGRARVLAAEHPDARAGLDALVARYRQYQDRPPAGPVVIVAISRWSGWSAQGAP